MSETHAHEHTLDYHEITGGIFIGTNQCCQAHFDERLRAAGITADISLEEGRIDQPFGVEFYLWLPVRDQAAPSQDQLSVGVSVLTLLLRMGRKVYVHCRQGHGRAPTLVAAYLIAQGRTVDEAVDLVSRKRPLVHLSEAQRAALEAFAADPRFR